MEMDMDMEVMMMRVDAWLGWASRFCCSTTGLFFQIQGCMICLILALGWFLASYVRGRELKKMQDSEEGGNNLPFLYLDINDLEHSAQAKLPRVSVIMPLKGIGEHQLSNWRSQITSLYGGPLEFLFIVESKDDTAFDAVTKLILNFQGEVNAKIVVAGFSTTCSQKIHNQLAGVESMHKDSKYVLFLDDDARLHPGSIGALVSCMEKNPKIFILTGYPFDIPSRTLGSYCIYEYHMPCSMGFATGGRTFFLWGGCMMMNAEDFRRDLYGMVSGLRYGGYSDDMTLAAVAGANKRLISSPPVAIFVHPLPSNMSFMQYWGYLRKQTFVLESYVSEVNWMMNRALFFSHCWLSWSFALPYFMALLQLAAEIRFLTGSPYFDSRTIYTGFLLQICLIFCTLTELLSLWNLTRVEINLCNKLSPEQDPVSINSYNWFMVFVALLVDNFLYPISAIYSHFTQYIDWGGVRYHLKNGRLYEIQRGKETIFVPSHLKEHYWSNSYVRETFKSLVSS